MTTFEIDDESGVTLEAEAERQGVTAPDLLKRYIGEGIDRERRRREWLEAAKPGFAAEAERLERDGPLLAEFRSGVASSEG